jgi:hypothetical protein
MNTAVALAILALAAIIVYQGTSWTPRRSDEQRRRNLAWLTALSLLDQLRRNPSVAVGRRGGSSSYGLRWETFVEPQPLRSEMSGIVVRPLNANATPLLQIRVTVRWGEAPARGIELRSIEFGPAM